MDFYLVMANVQNAITGVNLGETLARAHNMKLSNTHQTVALISYETSVPKYFMTSSSNYSIVHKDESYFTATKSWED